MKIVSLQKKLRYIISILVILVVVVVVLVIYPSIRDILALQKDINATESYLESQYQRSINISQRQSDIVTVVSSTAQFTGLTVAFGTELDIIQKLESIAEAHSIEQNLTVAYTDKEDSDISLPYYTFTFLNHGQMENHIAYLDSLLSEPYIVRIDSLDITRRNTQADRNDRDVSDVTMRFSAMLYAK